MLAAQPFHAGERGHLLPGHDLGEVFQPERFGAGQAGRDRVVAGLGRRHDLLPLLVEERGEEQEAVMLRTEAAAPLGDPALAQDHALPPLAEGVHHDGPFFEGDAHGPSVRKPVGGRQAANSPLAGLPPGAAK